MADGIRLLLLQGRVNPASSKLMANPCIWDAPPPCRARLLTLNRHLHHVSQCQAGLWGAVDCSVATLAKAESLRAWLARRRSLITAATFSLYFLPQGADGLLREQQVAALAGALAGGRLQRLTIHADEARLEVRAAWLSGLRSLHTLRAYASLSIHPSFSQLTALTAADLCDCRADGLPTGCLPASLLSLSLSLREGGESEHRLPPAVTAAEGLQELTLCSVVDHCEGLERLAGSLTSLYLETLEAGVPQVGLCGSPARACAGSRRRGTTACVPGCKLLACMQVGCLESEHVGACAGAPPARSSPISVYSARLLAAASCKTVD